MIDEETCFVQWPFMEINRLTDTRRTIESAVVVREHGTEKWCKVLIFLVEVREFSETNINTSVAVYLSNVYEAYLLQAQVKVPIHQ